MNENFMEEVFAACERKATTGSFAKPPDFVPDRGARLERAWAEQLGGVVVASSPTEGPSHD